MREGFLHAQEHLSFPSIIQYYTFNEGWGQYDTQKVVQAAHSQDPSRLWGAASGWVDPQDITADKGAKYQHYTGYVRGSPVSLRLKLLCCAQAWHLDVHAVLSCFQDGFQDGKKQIGES